MPGLQVNCGLHNKKKFLHASVTKSVTLTWGVNLTLLSPRLPLITAQVRGDAPGIYLVEAKAAAKRPRHRLACTTKDCLVPKVKSAKAENPGLRENYE